MLKQLDEQTCDFFSLPNFILQMANGNCDSLCRFELLLSTEVSWWEHILWQLFLKVLFSSVIKITYKKSNKDKMLTSQPVEQWKQWFFKFWIGARLFCKNKWDLLGPNKWRHTGRNSYLWSQSIKVNKSRKTCLQSLLFTMIGIIVLKFIYSWHCISDFFRQ